MELNQYLEVFIEESKEHLQNVNDQLLELEKQPDNLTIVNEIFRSAHTLKGMSATMGFEDLANLTHKMENVLDAIRNHKLQPSSQILDVLFASVDDLEAMVESISSGGDGKRDVSTVVAQLHAIETGESIPDTSEKSVEQEAVSQEGPITYDPFERTVMMQSMEQGFVPCEIVVRLSEACLLKAARVYMVFDVLEQVGEVIKSVPETQKLEEEKFEHEFTVTVLTKVEEEELKKRILKVSEVEDVRVKIIQIETEDATSVEEVQEQLQAMEVEPQHEEAANAKKASAGKQQGQKTIRVNIERLDSLMNLFEELVIDRGRLEQISKNLNNSELNETVERMSRISGDLQSIILNMRMVPVETVFNRFPRMVRQLAKDLGKKVNLEIVGAETELDRTVIDEIGDPLVHLLRNAIDHGIEMPDVRKETGKREEGTIRLKAYHSGNHVFIEIEDDGHGIDREKVLNTAIRKGLVTAQAGAAMTNSQVYDLILASGFSTADKISDISGRGVGLDVVKNTIESLGGSITIESTLGKGSVFSIQLPLTLSIISVLLVEMGTEKYAIPLSSIIETAIVKNDQILYAHNQKVIDFRGKIVPLIDLKRIFEVPNVEEDELHSVVIVRKGDKMAGLMVDSFIGQQEVVLKSLGDYLSTVFAISGATILGDGQVALIIDCNALIK
ncbi:chemotaxis protein CheA [Priestia koreensis]|uniref:chemotaxis protein CheA n=1 Tax=Priestia koreensis TaxID=284581 RepID=UPI001F57FD54|nr:chemotaxis protein CheA [Priestia koreensis]MCM3003752.1 chemotaxis protein CheA [Priestia koreensis]UNL83861.1 chemotaxis protein CheA [Priestia koreensis]